MSRWRSVAQSFQLTDDPYDVLAKDERDEKLKAITAEYAPKIAKLQAEASSKRVKVWDDWRKARAAG